MDVLILTHGDLANALLSSAKVIAGDLAGIQALCLDWADGLPEAQEKIARTLGQLDRQAGVLILTDIFGSTPCRAALSFQDPGRLEVLTGVNLPMVVRLGCRQTTDLSLEETARWLVAKGQGSICLGRDQACANSCVYPPEGRQSA